MIILILPLTDIKMLTDNNNIGLKINVLFFPIMV